MVSGTFLGTANQTDTKIRQGLTGYSRQPLSDSSNYLSLNSHYQIFFCTASAIANGPGIAQPPR